jgi:hypothetical protein
MRFLEIERLPALYSAAALYVIAMSALPFSRLGVCEDSFNLSSHSVKRKELNLSMD